MEELTVAPGEGGFEGIVGFEDTVIPDLQTAILSRHNILLLGLRGQAKTRIARLLVNLLDEYMPYIEGSELYDGSISRGFQFPKTLDEWSQQQWLDFDQHRNFLTPWLKPEMIRYIHNFETVVNAQFPTVSDYKLTTLQRTGVKLASSLRYKNNIFGYPYELKALLKYWLRYRQPEIEGL